MARRKKAVLGAPAPLRLLVGDRDEEAQYSFLHTIGDSYELVTLPLHVSHRATRLAWAKGLTLEEAAARLRWTPALRNVWRECFGGFRTGDVAVRTLRVVVFTDNSPCLYEGVSVLRVHARGAIVMGPPCFAPAFPLTDPHFTGGLPRFASAERWFARRFHPSTALGRAGDIYWELSDQNMWRARLLAVAFEAALTPAVSV